MGERREGFARLNTTQAISRPRVDLIAIRTDLSPGGVTKPLF
jgi:hypothetical protein